MTTATTHEYAEFVNALQLCIQSRIVGLVGDTPQTHSHAFQLHLAGLFPNDTGLRLFARLLPGTWLADDRYRFECDAETIMPSLTNFLMLTRLQPKNIQALATLDRTYEGFATQMGLLPASTQASLIDTLAAARDLIFTQAKTKGMTLRTIAERTGLTQATISKFKAGGDVMLTTFLKLVQAVGVTVHVKRGH